MWAAVSLLLAGLGIGASLVGAAITANNDVSRAKLAFRSKAHDIAGTLRVAIQREYDLVLGADAFLVEAPHATEAQFERWAATLQAASRYPEVAVIEDVQVVSRHNLSAFMTAANAPLAPYGLTMSRSVLLGAPEPSYCLGRLYVAGRVSFAHQWSDLCWDTGLFPGDYTGQLQESATLLGNVELLGIAKAVYRGGRVPATAAARRRLFISWVDVAVSPTILLGDAVRGYPGTVIVLRLRTADTPLIYESGTPLVRHSSTTVQVNSSTTLTAYGRAIGTSLFAYSDALAVLLGGSGTSFVFALLVFSLGTGRQRALRLVRQQTGELAEEAKRSAEARDAAVEASNAKSVFVATVGHELRTPLSGVIGTLDLLLDGELGEEERQHAEIIRSSSEALLTVINDLLDYSKIEAGRLELSVTSFAVADLIRERSRLLEPVAREKGLRFEIEQDQNLPRYLRGDPDRIGQVLMNLLSNAGKFTLSGSVTVRVSARKRGPRAVLRVEVRDTGIGIAPGKLDTVFEPFVQADSSTARKYGGTGLGLTISAQLVELMGGRMGADSEPDHGSTFWFDVPLEIAQAPEVVDIRPVLLDTGERNADGSLSESAPRVLVAEDNTVNQMLAVRLLDKCGFRADVVSNGVEALEAITRDDYVAVLMDCQMPEMDGYDASRAIRDRENGGAHMPIIAATAHSMSGDREKCLAAGMDEYVTKPIRAHDLSEAIARAIAAGADGNGSKRRSVTRTRRRRTRAPT